MGKCRNKNGRFVKDGELKRRQWSAEWSRTLSTTGTSLLEFTLDCADDIINNNNLVTAVHNYAIPLSPGSVRLPGKHNETEVDPVAVLRTNVIESETSPNVMLSDTSSTDNNTRSRASRTMSFDKIDGRRIVEPKVLIDRLLSGCEECGKTLNFTRIVNETRDGLGSYFWIMCECGSLNKVTSCKRHYAADKKKTKPIFDINTKAAIGLFFIYILL